MTVYKKGNIYNTCGHTRQVCTSGHKKRYSCYIYIYIWNYIGNGSQHWVGHRILVDSYFNLLKLFSDTYQRKISACGTVHLSGEEVPSDFSYNYLWLKRGNSESRVQGNLRPSAGRTNKKYMAFLIYTFHLQKETSRKDWKVWSPWLPKTILYWLTQMTGWQTVTT